MYNRFLRKCSCLTSQDHLFAIIGTRDTGRLCQLLTNVTLIYAPRIFIKRRQIRLIYLFTSERTVVILWAAPSGHQSWPAVVPHEAGDPATYHLSSLAVAHATRVCRVHQLLSVAVHSAFLLAL